MTNLDDLESFEFVGWDKEFTNVVENLEIKPIYNKNVFTVKFYDSNNNIISTQNVKINESAIAPSVDNVEGYTFVGWDKEFTNVLEDLEIKPIYNKKSYTVKFYDNFGNLIDEQTVPHGENAIEPINVDKEGYTFAGWDKEFTNVVEDLVVTGQYEAIYYTVTFIDMYGDVIEIKSVQSHTEVEAPTAPIVDYHTFDKWNQKRQNSLR